MSKIFKYYGNGKFILVEAEDASIADERQIAMSNLLSKSKINAQQYEELMNKIINWGSSNNIKFVNELKNYVEPTATQTSDRKSSGDKESDQKDTSTDTISPSDEKQPATDTTGADIAPSSGEETPENLPQIAVDDDTGKSSEEPTKDDNTAAGDEKSDKDSGQQQRKKELEKIIGDGIDIKIALDSRRETSDRDLENPKYNIKLDKNDIDIIEALFSLEEYENNQLKDANLKEGGVFAYDFINQNLNPALLSKLNNKAKGKIIDNRNENEIPYKEIYINQMIKNGVEVAFITNEKKYPKLDKDKIIILSGEEGGDILQKTLEKYDTSDLYHMINNNDMVAIPLDSVDAELRQTIIQRYPDKIIDNSNMPDAKAPVTSIQQPTTTQPQSPPSDKPREDKPSPLTPEQSKFYKEKIQSDRELTIAYNTYSKNMREKNGVPLTKEKLFLNYLQTNNIQDNPTTGYNKEKYRGYIYGLARGQQSSQPQQQTTPKAVATTAPVASTQQSGAQQAGQAATISPQKQLVINDAWWQNLEKDEIFTKTYEGKLPGNNIEQQNQFKEKFAQYINKYSAESDQARGLLYKILYVTSPEDSNQPDFNKAMEYLNNKLSDGTKKKTKSITESLIRKQPQKLKITIKSGR